MNSSVERSIRRKRLSWRALMCAAALVVGVVQTPQPMAAQAAVSDFSYFPTASTVDGRFMNLSGRNLNTVAGDTISLVVASDRSQSHLELGIFDGDTGGFWDSGTQAPSFRLLADPAGNGSGTTLVQEWSGSVMPDNGWFTASVANGPAAQAPSGHYFYRLVVSLPNANTVGAPGAGTSTSFKFRVRGTLALRASTDDVPQAFSFIASVSLATAPIIYPSWNPDPLLRLEPASLAGSTYDGSWRFFFDVPTRAGSLGVWDGDMDHGGTFSNTLDSDDPNTANEGVPSWAIGTAALPEGAKNLGSPQDDSTSAFQRRPPSVRYDLITPDGRVFGNENPSGNREWEQFHISSAGATADHQTLTAFPSGSYELRMDGVDMGNLNALKFFYDVLGVDEQGKPKRPLRADPIIGDTVWFDGNGDGVQNPGEQGIQSVLLELKDGAGQVLNTTATDAGGNYQFIVSAQNQYTVVVAASNFDAGGPLTGWSSTTGGEIQTKEVFTSDRLDYDFGYAEKLPGSVGDTVWLDHDGDGVYEPGAGELPIQGVTIRLFNATNQLVGTRTTSAAGEYLFEQLFPGGYRVAVDASTLPGGAVPTYDLDGTSTPHVAAFELGSGQHRRDVDFGYWQLGSVGDTVWRDSDADGVYEPQVGELPIQGVTVRLFTGANQPVGTRTTNAAGQYLFEQLSPGEYRVVVDPPSGFVQTYDLDGTATPNRADFAVGSGQHRRDVDFGYRPAQQPGTGTPGYWQNRIGQAAWPVDGLTLGGVWWSKAQLLDIMKGKEPANVDEKMVFHLAPAKLNVGVGNYSGQVEQWIRAADAWLAQHPYGSGVRSNTAAGAQGIAIKDKLDAYNNGWLGAPARR